MFLMTFENDELLYNFFSSIFLK